MAKQRFCKKRKRTSKAKIKTKDARARNVGQSGNTACLQLGGSRDSENKFPKTPGAEPSCRLKEKIARHCGAKRDVVRQMEWKNGETHWHDAVSSALNFPFVKDVSQNCCFWCCQLRKLRKSRRFSSCFDVVKFTNWRSLAQLPFSCLRQVQEFWNS